MKIDRYINLILTFLFGTMPDGDRKVWFHSQNLNEDRNGDVKGWPWHGRCWLHSHHRTLLHFSWNFWTHFCGLSVEADAEDGGVMFHWAFPPFSFWLTLPIFKKWGNGYDKTLFDFAVHNWAFWWQFGGNVMEWNSRDSKWKRGNFNFPDFFLGSMKHKEVVLETRNVMIPMPEGLYPAKAKLTRGTWKRPRWFAMVKEHIWVDIERGVPHQGKGENDYDCGIDGLFGCGIEGNSYPKAIAHVVEVALKNRGKYDGNLYAAYPSPPLDNSDLNALLQQGGKGPAA